MYKGKKIVVVMPAYNAEKTIKQTLDEVPMDFVDEVVLVDDNSKDDTYTVAKSLGINQVIKHDKNKGYGGNQKTCYDTALSLGADIVIMLHPDYQYTPKLLLAMISIIGNEVYPVVFGSRILGGGALEGKMPMYKYIANRALTLFQNILTGQKLSEYHTGYRAYSREVLEKVPYQRNNDDFIFDNEFIVQTFACGFKIGEVTCPTLYFEDASSINFSRSMKYGLGCVRNSILYRFHKWGVYSAPILKGLN